MIFRLQNRLSQILLFFTLSMAAIILPVCAEPMNSPSLSEGVKYSPDIVIAKYIGYDSKKPADYFEGVPVQYKIQQVLKGSRLAKEKTITVQYAFQDGSACMEPSDWKFVPKRDLPSAGSDWILFLSTVFPKTQAYSTYRGDFGRWKAEPQKIKLVTQAMRAQ